MGMPPGGTVKTIELTQGKVAKVDDADFEVLSRHKWKALRTKTNWYAARTLWFSHTKCEAILMHRFLLGLKRGDRREGDHRDGDGLNNQRFNLRVSTKKQNRRNSRGRRDRRGSRYKGVAPSGRQAKPWVARITINGKHHHLGSFFTEEAAALTYNFAAQNKFGEFANLNQVAYAAS